MLAGIISKNILKFCIHEQSKTGNFLRIDLEFHGYFINHAIITSEPLNYYI